MRTYMLIGGIGSGKSTVSSMLGDLGASCIDLDEVGHEVLLDPETASALAREFGGGVLCADGSVDRRALAAAAFSSPERTEALNGITQPRIVDAALGLLREAAARGTEVAVVEISPYEGPHGRFEPIERVSRGVIAVTAPEDARVQRAVARGLPEADVRNRMARQATDAQRVSWADYVLRNDGPVDVLRSQVESLWRQIRG